MSNELFSLISKGEDSTQQFKRDITNADSLAADMVAFSNGAGGKILVGVSDDSEILGLNIGDTQRINQLISNTASQHVLPSINPTTENIVTDSGIVLVINIPSGINKPYQDKNGVFWVKSGADKRKATSREEIQRLFQRNNLIHADEIRIQNLNFDDLDTDFFKLYFQKRFDKKLEEELTPIKNILENMNLMSEGALTLSGALLFGKSPQFKLPAFIVKAGLFDSNDISTTNYHDSRDITGKLLDVFNNTVFFIVSNLRHLQGDQDFNSIGIPEIPNEAVQEIVANALIHRDYFISSPIRVFVFRNRVEVISPGHLPNNLTIDNIKSGNSNARNPVLASHANHLIPYRGYGSGIIRALSKYSDMEFCDDREGNSFKVTFFRKELNI